jgi:alpha-tubulin suppressor-like RCC1 family protein
VADAIAIAAGYSHSLALEMGGTVWSWGNNSNGQLGNNSLTPSPLPVKVLGLGNAIAVASGGDHSLALLDDGTVWAWGRNNYGQLGNSSTTDSKLPVQVQLPSSCYALAVAAGYDHSLARCADGTLKAWGRNSYGQLGDASTFSRSLPVSVRTLTAVVAMDGGGEFSVAVQADGSVWTWGRNTFDALGDGLGAPRSTPFRIIAPGSGAVDAVAGSYFALATFANGTAKGWGLNLSGQIGIGSTSMSVPTPAPVALP